MDELSLGKIVRPQSPTLNCQINPEDKSHIQLILSETNVNDKSADKILSVRSNEIVCALSSKTIYLSHSGQVISNIDLPYYWCNFCSFKTDDKQKLLTHLMEHRFRCQKCLFQTFSRIDVVRHMVEEHKEIDVDNLKFCVLLPDLLKHELKNSPGKQEEKDTVNQPQEKKQASDDVEPKSVDSKRKRHDSPSNEKEVVKKKKGPLSSKVSKPIKENAIKEESDSEEDLPLITRRTTRSRQSTPPTPTPSNQQQAPSAPSPPEEPSKPPPKGFCYECGTCKFRTFQKPVLNHHGQACGGKKNVQYALKIVSKSQAKEIEENDKLYDFKKKTTPAKIVSPSSKNSKKESNVRGPPAGKESISEKDSVIYRDSVKSADKKKVDEEKEDEADSNMGTPVVEMDLADEGEYMDEDEDDDDDYTVDDEDCDDDNDEDFLPSSQKRNKEKKSVVNKSIKPEPQTNNQRRYRCCLCTNAEDLNFKLIQIHYTAHHPGGSLIMTENNQLIYFCVGQNCSFKSPNPQAWFQHVQQCQREAFENPNLQNTIHQSITNTANLIRENSTNKTFSQTAASGRSTPEGNDGNTPHCANSMSPDMSRVKKEKFDDDARGQVNYQYGEAPVPMYLTVNKAAALSNEPAGKASIDPTTQLSSTNNPISASSPSTAISVSMATQVANIKTSGSPSKTSTISSVQNPVSSKTSTIFPELSPAEKVIAQNASRSNNAIVNLLMAQRMNAKNQNQRPSTQTNNVNQTPPSSSPAKPLTTTTSTSKVTYILTTASTSTTSSSVATTSAMTNKPTTTPSNTWNKPASTVQTKTTPTPNTNYGNRNVASVKPTPVTVAQAVPFDANMTGHFKCAHCRILTNKPIEIRSHMIERHKMNPLYGLDMQADEKKQPRFIMFCPKDKCTFCTKNKNLFLKHIDECASQVKQGGKLSDEYKRRLETTKTFALKTLDKLQTLTK